MLVKLRKRIKEQKGFTLVELMVVIAILGILSALAIPKLSGTNNAAKDGKLTADLRTLDSVLTIYYSTYKDYPTDTTLGVLKTAGLIADIPKSADGTTALTYSHNAGTATYDLSGVNSGSKTVYSPGSASYTP